MSIEEINILEELDFTKQATFAYLACERLYPNYLYFSNSFGFGSPIILRETIDYLYQNLFETDPDKNKILSLIGKLDDITPDTEDFSTIFVSSALDACTAVNESLHFLIDRDFSRIKDISTFAIDSVDMYIQEIDNLDFNEDKNFRQKIDSHPLMQREKSVQLGIVNFLIKSKTIDFEDVQTLLRLQNNNNKGILDL